MERKLASVQRIVELSPIPEADKIERAKVLGWDCVVKKGEFKVGDLCVYIEIDSLIPKTIWSGFLFKEGHPSEKYRLKTCKLKGQISQGLVLSLGVLPVEQNMNNGVQEWQEGEDITDILTIEKYEPTIPANLQGIVKSTFPSFIPKTDETRIQTEPWLLTKMQGKEIYITEKVDGSSMTVYVKDGEFNVCSRNQNLQQTEGNAYWKCAIKENLPHKIAGYGRDNIALQGELIGPGVQGNKYNEKDLSFLIYSIYDIAAGRYLDCAEMLVVCTDLELDTVPFLGDSILTGEVEDWVKLSTGQSLINTEVLREGIVVRGTKEENIERYGRFSFKVISPEFLLKNKE